MTSAAIAGAACGLTAGTCALLRPRPITSRRPPATGSRRRDRPYGQEVTVTVTEAPNPRPVDGCLVQPWRV